MKKILGRLFFRKTLSLVMSAFCLSSVVITSGCRFEHELLGSAFSFPNSESTSSYNNQETHKTDTSNSFEIQSSSSHSELSGITNPDTSSSSDDELQQSLSENSDISLSNSDAEIQKNETSQNSENQSEVYTIPNYLRLLTNSSFTSLGFRQPRDALALMLFAPLDVQLNQISALDSVALSECENLTFLLVPIYNNSTIELFMPKSDSSADGEDDMELIYRKDSTLSGYGLLITAANRDETANLHLLIHSGGYTGDYTIVFNRAMLSGGGYLLNNNSLEKFSYIDDAINALTRRDALDMVVNELTSQLNVTYKWENTSHTSVHLSVEENEDTLSGEYYLTSSDLLDGKGCCYYMISLGRRTYDENGSANGELLVNRFLVTIPGNQIVPMYNEYGIINNEYNNIII